MRRVHLITKMLASIASCGSRKYGILNDEKQFCLRVCFDPAPSDVPKGYVVVYVGPQQQRFIIHANHLHHPFFRILLKQSEDEFEFCNSARLIIPCDAPLFELLLSHIENNQHIPSDPSQALQIIDFYKACL